MFINLNNMDTKDNKKPNPALIFLETSQELHPHNIFMDCDLTWDSVVSLLEEYSQLKDERIKELEDAMQEFVNRVDKGEVRSTRTYNKFKTLLNNGN